MCNPIECNLKESIFNKKNVIISCLGFPTMYSLTTWFLNFFSLPWQGLQAATKQQKYDKICKKKLSTPIEVCSPIIFTFTMNDSFS